MAWFERELYRDPEQDLNRTLVGPGRALPVADALRTERRREHPCGLGREDPFLRRARLLPELPARRDDRLPAPGAPVRASGRGRRLGAVRRDPRGRGLPQHPRLSRRPLDRLAGRDHACDRAALDPAPSSPSWPAPSSRYRGCSSATTSWSYVRTKRRLPRRRSTRTRRNQQPVAHAAGLPVEQIEVVRLLREPVARHECVSGEDERACIRDERRAAPDRPLRPEVDRSDVAVEAAARLRVRLVGGLHVEDAVGLSRPDHLFRHEIGGARCDLRRPGERCEVERVPQPVRPRARRDEIARARSVLSVEREDGAGLPDVTSRSRP